MVAQFGPPATVRCELRQVRKEATVTVQLCAGVWLGWVASQPFFNLLFSAFRLGLRFEFSAACRNLLNLTPAPSAGIMPSLIQIKQRLIFHELSGTCPQVATR